MTNYVCMETTCSIIIIIVDIVAVGLDSKLNCNIKTQSRITEAAIPIYMLTSIVARTQ